MTIVAPPAAIAPDATLSLVQPAQVATPGQTPQAPQNPTSTSLVEYLATMNPNGLASGASPSELAQDVVKHLQGFFDRSQSITGRVRALAGPTPPSPTSMSVVHRGPARAALDPSALRVGPQPAKAGVDGQQMERVIQALSMVFDYSIETQLVVRGATQMAGAANTLLRGQ